MIIIEYKDEKDRESILSEKIALGYEYAGEKNHIDGNFLLLSAPGEETKEKESTDLASLLARIESLETKVVSHDTAIKTISKAADVKLAEEV